MAGTRILGQGDNGVGEAGHGARQMLQQQLVASQNPLAFVSRATKELPKLQSEGVSAEAGNVLRRCQALAPLPG